MSKRQKSWAEKLDQSKALNELGDPATWAEHSAKVAADFAAKPHEDPLLQDLPLRQADARARSMEIRAKELEMGLYLAKAKIAELELQLLRAGQP